MPDQAKAKPFRLNDVPALMSRSRKTFQQVPKRNRKGEDKEAQLLEKNTKKEKDENTEKRRSQSRGGTTSTHGPTKSD